MYWVESLNLLNTEDGFTVIESSWEFDNPTPNLEYACTVARILAIQDEGDKQFRVVCVESGKVWANYVLVKYLVSTVEDRINTAPICPKDIQPKLHEVMDMINTNETEDNECVAPEGYSLALDPWENAERACPHCDVVGCSNPMFTDEDDDSFECCNCGTVFYIDENGEEVVVEV